MNALTARLDREAFADEWTPIWAAVVVTHDVEVISKRAAADRRPHLKAVPYDDDRPGMMRVHIAQERGLALCEKFTRAELRRIARDKGVRGRFPTKRDLAVALALAGVKA